MIRSLVCAVLLCCAVPLTAPGQDGPEAAAAAFGRAIKANDWAGAARRMHPAALRQLRQLFEPLLDEEGGAELRSRFFGVGSGAEFASTPDTVLFARFLRAVLTQEPLIANALRTARLEPLGHVKGAGDTVFVVTRTTMTMDGMTMTEFDVMPFVRERGRWLGLLKADFTNLVAMLRQALGVRQT